MGINYGTAMLLSRTGVFLKYRESSKKSSVMMLGRQTMSLKNENQKSAVINSFKNHGGGVDIRKESLIVNSFSEYDTVFVPEKSSDSINLNAVYLFFTDSYSLKSLLGECLSSITLDL